MNKEYRFYCSLNLTDRSPSVISYNLALCVIYYMASLICIVYCNVKIVLTLKSIQLSAVFSNGNNSTMERSITLQKRKKTVVLIIMITIYLISWTPYTFAVIKSITWRSPTPSFLNVATLLGKSSTCYNPIIYAIFYKDFRKKVKIFFKYVRQKINLLRKKTPIDEIEFYNQAESE